jgi:hypothetical protein
VRSQYQQTSRIVVIQKNNAYDWTKNHRPTIHWSKRKTRMKLKGTTLYCGVNVAGRLSQAFLLLSQFCLGQHFIHQQNTNNKNLGRN